MSYDWQQYLANNPDLGAAGLDTEEEAMWHYNAHGQTEGRAMPTSPTQAVFGPTPAPTYQTPTGFDWQQYVGNYADLGAAGIDTPEEAAWHYSTYGQNEGRNWSAPQQQQPSLDSYLYGTADIGLGRLTSDQYSQFMSLAPQDAYNLARTQYGMNRDQIADLYNRYNPNSAISSQDLYTQFDPGLRNYLMQNNLGYYTYDEGEGVGKAMAAGTPMFGQRYGLVTAYNPNQVRMVFAPAGSAVVGPTPISPDGLYHWSDGSTSRTDTPPSSSQRPPQAGPGPSQRPPTSDLPMDVATFNTDLSSPFSGANWRSTVLDKVGGESLYNLFSSFKDEGKSLGTIEREYSLNPGEGMAFYEEAVKYAKANNLPIPHLPAVTRAVAPFYNYGFGPGQNLLTREIGWQSIVNPIAAYLDQIYAQREAAQEPEEEVTAAQGGLIQGYKNGGLSRIHADPVIKRYLRGGGGGQEDDIPARLSAGEYVMDADVVAALGDGNPEAGARKLDKMRENIRTHKRSASAKKIPPKAKKPEQYLKGK